MSAWFVISVVIILSYVLLMIWLSFGISKSSVSKDNVIKPSVSIIVSLRNESQNVDSLLRGLQVLKYPKNRIEIILVNDHSTDATYQDLLKYESSQVLILNNGGEGKKQAIETGVKASKNKWIAVTDADCQVPELWIDAMVESISETTKMVLGPVFILDANGFLNSLQAIEFLGLQGATAGSAGMRNPASANAANMMFRKDVFEELHPYENNYQLKTGDDQFLLMAVTEKYPNSVVYARRKDAIVLTKPVSTWKQYFNQRIRWASKGTAYSQLAPKLVGLIVFFTSVLLVVSLMISTYTGKWSVFALPFVAKVLSDLMVIVPMKKFSKSKVSFIHYWASTLVYPFVVVGSVIGGFVKR